MGIDARMLIRYRGVKPTDATLARWSWDLCAAIGAQHFFISDGLKPKEYHVVYKAWSTAFDAHPQYARYEALRQSGGAHVECENVRQAILADLGPYPECLHRAIELTHSRYPVDEDDDVPATHRAPGMAWTQDGPTILALPRETFLEVSLTTRYYGPEYERGDILIICAVAEWIEQNMQPCEVWYGGDSSGVLAQPFGPEARAKMRAHLFGPHGRDYHQHDRRGSFPTPKPCGLCVRGENRFDRYGYGGRNDEFVGVRCSGCGKNFESHDGGVTWDEKKEAF